MSDDPNNVVRLPGRVAPPSLQRLLRGWQDQHKRIWDRITRRAQQLIQAQPGTDEQDALTASMLEEIISLEMKYKELDERLIALEEAARTPGPDPR